MKVVTWKPDMALIANVRLFQDIGQSCLSQLASEFRAYELNAGEVLLSPFTSNQHVYVVVHGSLQVYLGSLENPLLSSIDIGECTGEISALDQQCPSAYVVAPGPATVLSLHREALLGLFEQSPRMMQNLLSLLCERVRKGNRLILDSEQNSQIDSLTGSYNRRWLEHVFERERTRCSFSEQPLCLLMLDVDHFKGFNDQHGHLAGDYALCMVAHNVRKQLRPKDSLVRYGGEEFLVVLPELELDEAVAIGERLRQCLEQASSFYSPLGPLPGVTVSIGLAQLGRNEALDSLIARADSALYRAKLKGRNSLCL